MEDKRVVSDKQIEANRINASKSTGPRTEEGKRKSRMNALTHGITAGILALNPEQLAERATFVTAYVGQLAPVGPIELSYAEAAAGQAWRLKRAQNVDETLFNLREVEISNDPAISQALAFANNSAEFQRLTIYESRIQRSMERSLKALNDLQNERKTAHAAALEQAMGLARLNHLNDLPYDPAADQFDFSPEQIHAALRLSDRITDLTHYRKAGWNSAYRSRVPVPAIVELPEAA